MGIFIKKKGHIPAAILAMIMCVLMIIFADTLVLSAKKAMVLWLSDILPSMLPFFICVNFMNYIGITGLLPVNIFPFVVSVMSGYPAGAKVVGDMYRSGYICDDETRRLMSFCSTSGPVFMIGAVGVGMLGSQAAGFVIALSHYAAALLNGLIYSCYFRNNSVIRIPDEYPQETDIMTALTNAIFSAFKSMSIILAYIIFFMFIMDTISNTGAMERIHSEVLQALVKGSMEMTVGCSSFTDSDIPLKQCAVWTAVIISWGGLSIIGQSMSMLSGTGITFKYLVLTKLTHCAFAGIIALFLTGLVLS